VRYVRIEHELAITHGAVCGKSTGRRYAEAKVRDVDAVLYDTERLGREAVALVRQEHRGRDSKFELHRGLGRAAAVAETVAAAGSAAGAGSAGAAMGVDSVEAAVGVGSGEAGGGSEGSAAAASGTQ